MPKYWDDSIFSGATSVDSRSSLTISLETRQPHPARTLALWETANSNTRRRIVATSSAQYADIDKYDVRDESEAVAHDLFRRELNVHTHEEENHWQWL